MRRWKRAAPRPWSAAAAKAEPGELIGLPVANTSVKDLWGEIETNEGRIHPEIDNLELAEPLFDMLENARRLLSESRSNYVEAHRLTASVEHRRLLSQRVKAYSCSHAVPLLVYEVGWAIALGLANVVLTMRMSGDAGTLRTR